MNRTPRQRSWWRALRGRPRLLFAIAAGSLVWTLLPAAWMQHDATRTLVGWNVGALTYLVLALVMMLRASHEQIRRRALQQDDGRWLVLGLSVLASTAVLVAVASQLSSVKNLPGPQRTGHVALAADVSFMGTAMRAIGLMHCVLAFFFNTTVLALTINIAASLF